MALVRKLKRAVGLLHAGSFLIFIVMPTVFIVMSAVTACLLSPLEGWPVKQAFGFSASAATGGAIQLEGHGLAPVAFLSRCVAMLSGSACVGIFGFMVAMINNLLPEDLDDAAADHHLWVHMMELLLIALVFFTVTAALLGVLLLLVEGQSFRLCFNTVFSAELGGGIPVDLLQAKTVYSDIAIVLMSIWGIGITGIMVSLTGEVFMSKLGSKVVQEEEELAKSSRCPLLGALALTYISVPTCILLAMALVGATGTLSGDGDLETRMLRSFERALPTVTGGAAVVYPAPSNLSLVQQVVMIGTATVGFVIVNMGIALGSSTTTLVFVRLAVGSSGTSLMGAARDLLLALAVQIPVLVIITSLPLGFLIMLSEGWPLLGGFWWCVAAQLGGGMSLSDGSFQSLHGRAAGVLIAAWSVALTGFSVGLSSAPGIQPLIDWLLKRSQPCATLALDGGEVDVGRGVGAGVGACDGSGVGEGLGWAEGTVLGSGLGRGEGSEDGAGDGSEDGCGDGGGVGSSDGIGVGGGVGFNEGAGVGCGDGVPMSEQHHI